MMEPDVNGFYAMPTAPPPRPYSRERSPAVVQPARSTSRSHRRMSSSHERPTSLYVNDGASNRHKSYRLTGPAPAPAPPYVAPSTSSAGYHPSPLAATAPMGRSLSVSYGSRPVHMRASSSSGPRDVQVSFAPGPSSRRDSSHSRSASGAGVQYYYGGSSRTRPVSYYGHGGYDGYDYDDWEVPSPVGSFSRSPTRHPYEMPTAPAAPINAYRAEDDLKRLEQIKYELEHLRLREAEERERGRTAERRLKEIRTQAEADPRLSSRVTEAERQAAVALAQQQEYERKRAEVTTRYEKLAAHTKNTKPQVILPNGKPLKSALKQTVAVTPAPTVTESTATQVNQNMADQAPPKNPQDYQAKIPKNLISRAALVEKGLTYEEHKDYLIVKRYLSQDEIKSLLSRTAEIRKQREAVEKYRALRAAADAKVAEEAAKPTVMKHTTTDGRNVAIVTMPQKTPPPEVPPPKDWKEEKAEWEAEKKAREDARKAEEAEWDAKRRANEEKFKLLEAREAAARAEEAAKTRVKRKVVRKGWFY